MHRASGKGAKAATPMSFCFAADAFEFALTSAPSGVLASLTIAADLVVGA
jgi:hypothetical protein